MEFAYNADNDILATGCRDYCIIKWQVDDWKKLNKIEMHQSMNGLILSLAFLLNGMLVSGAKDEDKIRIWSVTGKLLQTLSGHSNHGHRHIVSLIVLPNKTLASAGSDTIKIWNIENTVTGPIISSICLFFHLEIWLAVLHKMNQSKFGISIMKLIKY